MLPIILIAVGLTFIGLGAWSLWAGKTIGLYGVIETNKSVFFWIYVGVYFLLGAIIVAMTLRFGFTAS